MPRVRVWKTGYKHVANVLPEVVAEVAERVLGNGESSMAGETAALAKRPQQTLTAAEVWEWTPEQKELIKRTVCRKATDDELALFLMTATRMRLDPFKRQIHAVKRYDRELGEVMAIQVGIDGYRSTAERTGRYMPGPRAEFRHDEKGKLISAIAYVKKFSHGEWHVIDAEAFYDDYVQTKKDGTPVAMWRKPRIMLAKCAEAQALRKAFPDELAGTHTEEEMGQADNPEPIEMEAPGVPILAAPTVDPIAELEREILSAPTEEALTEIGGRLRTRTKAEKDRLKEPYLRRQKELREQEPPPPVDEEGMPEPGSFDE